MLGPGDAEMNKHTMSGMEKVLISGLRFDAHNRPKVKEALTD